MGDDRENQTFPGKYNMKNGTMEFFEEKVSHMSWNAYRQKGKRAIEGPGARHTLNISSVASGPNVLAWLSVPAMYEARSSSEPKRQRKRRQPVRPRGMVCEVDVMIEPAFE